MPRTRAPLAVPTFESLTAEISSRSSDQPTFIIGPARRQRLVHRAVASLAARRIGVECMDSQAAAARTHPEGEGRKVTLA